MMYIICKVSLLCTLIVVNLTARPIDTIFGSCEVNEPVLLELLDCSSMQRLKKVQQSGIGYFVRDHYSFTRYDHSVGVWMLCRMFGASLQEQVAALLHDASHTVFSHVGDLLFDHQGDDAYQDAIHASYLKKTDAYAILCTYGMEQVILDEAKNGFTLLEQDLPDLCADRLEYNLHVGLYEGDLTRDDIKDILAHIHYRDGIWYFDDASAARRFALVTVALTERLWGSAWNGFINHRAAVALKRAMQINLIDSNDIHFGYDEDIWYELHTTTDDLVSAAIKSCTHYQGAYYLVTEHDRYDYWYQPKCRAVDPLILTDKGLQRLSTIDASYALTYQRLQKKCKEGYYLQVI